MSKRIIGHFNLGLGHFVKRIGLLVRQPAFLFLTVVGNSLIVLAAVGLYYFEHGVNPKISTWLDTIWWAVATVTTVGYGDISPITHQGKIIGIFMMIIGTAFFWCYTAMFAGAIMSTESEEIDKLDKKEKKHEN